LKIEKNGGKMAAWLDTFVSMYKKETVAETNVKNLPKVNWKDETFYVSFTPDGAVLYNDYGNEVSLIDNAKSVEEVNKYLNENSIVASIDGNDSTDCEDKDENKCSDNQEENDKEADRTVVGNEDIEDSSVDTGADVTADVDDSFENELKKVAEAPELPSVNRGINNDNIARGVDEGGNIEGTSGMPSVDSLEPGSNESTANVKEASMPMEDPDKPSKNETPETVTESASVKNDKKRLQVAFGVENPGSSIQSFEQQALDPPNAGGCGFATDSDGGSSDSSSDDETTGSLKTAGEVCPVCGKNPCVCKSKGECKDEKSQPQPAKYINDSMVSKASFNKLVARINSLEKTIKSAIGDINVDDGIGEDGMGHAHSEPGPDSEPIPEVTGIGGSSDDDSSSDTTGNLKINSKNVKAEDSSDVGGSTGFQDIANGVSDIASGVGDAVSNAFDSACSWSQGDHIDYGSKNGNKRLIAFSEQQYAHTEVPNDAYDLNSEEAEVQHFEEAAQDTQKVIDKEHELDLSNMNDRVKLNENFLNELFSIGNDIPVENNEVEEVVEAPVDDVAEEPMVDEVVDTVEDPVDVEEDVEEDVPESVDTVEESPTNDDSVEEIQVQEDGNPEEDVTIMLENPEDLEEFMNQMCPCCEEEKSLQGVAQIGDYVGVKCAKCGQEYAVNNKTKEIFARK
jgi:hypothetical protein